MLRRVATALGTLILAFALLAGMLRSGGRYFYCEAMGLSPSDPCVAANPSHPHSNNPADEVRPQHIDCCEIVTLPSMPEGARAEGPSVPPAAVHIVATPVQALDPAHADASRLRERASAHWRAPPRSSNQIHARLMVFLT